MAKVRKLRAPRIRNLLVTWLRVTVQDSKLRLVHLTLKILLFVFYHIITVLNFLLFSIESYTLSVLNYILID